jgi:hypothetical protein
MREIRENISRKAGDSVWTCVQGTSAYHIRESRYYSHMAYIWNNFQSTMVFIRPPLTSYIENRVRECNNE